MNKDEEIDTLFTRLKGVFLYQEDQISGLKERVFNAWDELQRARDPEFDFHDESLPSGYHARGEMLCFWWEDDGGDSGAKWPTRAHAAREARLHAAAWSDVKHQENPPDNDRFKRDASDTP